MPEQRVAVTRCVPGRDWIEGGPEGQADAWQHLWASWHRWLAQGGWRLLGKPRETIEYDEQQGRVYLHISARADGRDRVA